MHVIVKQWSEKCPFASYFRPVEFMKNELKPVPDSIHMYLNSCGKIRGHLCTSAHWVGVGGGGGEVVTRHLHPQGWRVAKCFAGFPQRPR